MSDFPLAQPTVGSTGWGPSVNSNFAILNNQNVKAWVNFHWNGAAIVINAQYNVASVTRNQAGDYTISFSNNFANANYILLSTCDNTVYGNGASTGVMGGNAPAVGSVRMFTHKSSVGPFDPAYVMAACIGLS
jgi:hypothetical protein